MRPTALLRACEDGDTELVRKTLQDGLDDRLDAVRALLIAAGATEAATVAEPPTLPWPAVVPGAPDYTDPVAVVRGFIVELAQWERDAVASDRRSAVGSSGMLELFRQRDELAAVYLTDRERTYRAHSFGTPTEFDEREILHAVDYPKPARCELLVRDPAERGFRYERVYTVLKKRGEWRLDSLKSRPIGTKDWTRQLL